MKLYSYPRSSAAYRVRIALNYKNLSYDIIQINLLKAEHRKQSYIDLNPQASVPTLIDGNLTLGQSAAILEYLEERYPETPLLPKAIADRAWVRYVMQIIVSDMHPLNNLGVTNYLKENLHQDKTAVLKWYFHWLTKGFDALETIIKPKSGRFCLHDNLTFADVCLIPQIYNALRYEFDMTPYPTLLAINEHCLKMACFIKAKPENQPD